MPAGTRPWRSSRRAFGQNGHIAWGLTTTESDTQDLFVESRRSQSTRSVSHRRRTQADRGGEADDRGQRHGPGAAHPAGHASRPGHVRRYAGCPRRRTAGNAGMDGFQPRHRPTAEALFRINRAKDREAFLAALRLYQSPAQNLVFAAADGAMGSSTPAWCRCVNPAMAAIQPTARPRRIRLDRAGALRELAAALDPRRARSSTPTTWSRRSITRTGSATTGPGFRAKRILELLGERERHDIASFSAIQMDTQAVQRAIWCRTS